MKRSDVLLQYEIKEIIAIIITGGKYDKTFYQGFLIEVNDDNIVIELEKNKNTNHPTLKSFKYDTFIFATPLERYH
ncbi:hypothetical protein [Flavobacterium sp. U410]|jgi:hypothetical protein